MATILLVDDNTLCLEAVAQNLKQLGHAPLSFSNPIDALRTAETQNLKVDMLLTDIDMPNMNGVQLAQRVRDSRPNLPVALMTGGINRPSTPNAPPVLPKPFGLTTLKSFVDSILALSRPASPTACC